mmetsp:Transcript_94454/g.243963  ORF Transcript_94454/g.243963 Transcript_94454/m.243963 type:complete len:228 (+) Transcript_94454:60-743(+)
MSVDAAWSAVVQNIQKRTYTSSKGDCWLSDELARAYQAVSNVSSEWRRGTATFHSIELWHTATGELVAGEIGYTCGSVYSSCTGFTQKDEYPGSGGVQLAALGRWLVRCGFEVWDLGMELDYKLELGARNVPRAEWARRIRKLRTCVAELTSPAGADADAFSLLAGADAASAALDAERSGKAENSPAPRVATQRRPAAEAASPSPSSANGASDGKVGPRPRPSIAKP